MTQDFMDENGGAELAEDHARAIRCHADVYLHSASLGAFVVRRPTLLDVDEEEILITDGNIPGYR